jgi:hypothetical protein
MKGVYVEFDFPDLEPHHALKLLTQDLAHDVFYMAGGRPIGVRKGELLALYIDLGLQAAVGLAREWIDTVKEIQARDEQAGQEPKPNKKSATLRDRRSLVRRS